MQRSGPQWKPWTTGRVGEARHPGPTWLKCASINVTSFRGSKALVEALDADLILLQEVRMPEEDVRKWARAGRTQVVTSPATDDGDVLAAVVVRTGALTSMAGWPSSMAVAKWQVAGQELLLACVYWPGCTSQEQQDAHELTLRWMDHVEAGCPRRAERGVCERRADGGAAGCPRIECDGSHGQ